MLKSDHNNTWYDIIKTDFTLAAKKWSLLEIVIFQDFKGDIQGFSGTFECYFGIQEFLRAFGDMYESCLFIWDHS